MKLEDITLPNINNFFQGNLNLLRYHLSLDLPQHQKEQALYRAVLCSSCMSAGKCKICKCSAPGLFFAPEKEDSLEKWGKMLSKEDWEEFKEKNNLQIPENFAEAVKEPHKNFLREDFTSYETMNKDLVSTLDLIISSLPEILRNTVKILKDPEKIDDTAASTLHVLGRAVDLKVASKVALAEIVKLCLNRGLSVGISPGHLHVDNRKPQEIFIENARVHDTK